jgi:hypothetical protein
MRYTQSWTWIRHVCEVYSQFGTMLKLAGPFNVDLIVAFHPVPPRAGLAEAHTSSGLTTRRAFPQSST